MLTKGRFQMFNTICSFISILLLVVIAPVTITGIGIAVGIRASTELTYTNHFPFISLLFSLEILLSLRILFINLGLMFIILGVNIFLFWLHSANHSIKHIKVIAN